jgi:hypothetical protein
VKHALHGVALHIIGGAYWLLLAIFIPSGLTFYFVFRRSLQRNELQR